MLVRRTIKQRLIDWLFANPGRIIVLSFIFVILIGTILLSLPFATYKDVDFSIFDALFTSVSATCVTGLIVTDTATSFTLFGKIVIIILIQIGGLGLVTITSFALSVINKKVSFKTRQIALETAGAFTFTETNTLLKFIIGITFIFEFLGAIILSIEYVPVFGLMEGIGKATFQSISAYCNAGFDLMGDTTFGPYSSLTGLATNHTVLFTTSLLIVFGGLGFVVWVDLFKFRQRKRLLLHTKVTLLFTVMLLLIGMIMVLVFEWNNPNTIGQEAFSFSDKIVNAFMQSVTYRTAGFNSLDLASLTDGSKATGIVLMFIGAGSGSTGGGVKITTIAIILYTVISEIKGSSDTIIYKNIVPNNIVRRAVAILFVGITTVATFSIAVAMFEYEKIMQGAFSFVDIVFEMASAFATVGLSSIGTGNLCVFSKLLIIVAMYLGRVGPIALLLSFVMKDKNKTSKVYPEGQIHIG